MKTLIKILSILLIAVVLSSCDNTKKIAPEKPFIVMFKYPDSKYAAAGYCRYQYYDAVGNIFETFDLPTKYNIGDTIK